VAPILVYALLTHMRDWYFATGLLLALFFASRSTDRPAEAPEPLLRTVTTALVLLLSIGLGGFWWVHRQDMRLTDRFVRAANARLDAGAVVYQVDGSGFTGYWLRARVVNGDGLVNSPAYRARLRADELSGYLTDIGATHLITNARSPAEPLLAHHGLVVRQRDASLVLDTGETRNPFARFRLYAVRPDAPRP
jgi:hypothetical protein